VGRTTSSLVLRERIRAARVPRVVPGKTIVLATWNVRELGRAHRSPEALTMIARILGRFSLVELRESLGAPSDSIQMKLEAWFWLTTYASFFSGISGGALARTQGLLEELLMSGRLHWPGQSPYRREPLPQRFDFRHARARALSLRLARRVDAVEGPFDLGVFGAQGMLQLVGGPRRHSPGNRFFGRGQLRSELEFSLISDQGRRAHLVSDQALEALRAGDDDLFVQLRTQSLNEMEEEAVAEWLKLVEQS
jgi:hypothetical protein